jgi:hypothetical protein
MSLTDVMSAAGHGGFAQIGFVISFVVFALIVVWALSRSKEAMQAEARSVLDDGFENTDPGASDLNAWSRGPERPADNSKEPVHGRQ